MKLRRANNYTLLISVTSTALLIQTQTFNFFAGRIPMELVTVPLHEDHFIGSACSVL